MKNKISKLLYKLIKKANEIEENITISREQSTEKINQWADTSNSKVRADDAVFEHKKNSLKQDAIEHWNEVKTNFEQGIVKVQLDFRTSKYDPNAGTATLRANWAEDDAELSIYIALKALSNAEKLIIIALKERAKIHKLDT